VTDVAGYVGNFKSTITGHGGQQVIEHGVAIIATGALESVPREYCFGDDDRIITSLDFDRMLNDFYVEFKNVKAVAFIQCVGSREKQRLYCSRVCCSHAIANALELKRRNPEISVYVLNRDIRTYGEREFKYTEARKAGVVFLKYQPADKPKVRVEPDSIKVTAIDHVLLRPLEISADLLVLASAIVPPPSEELARLFKVPLNDDGFFVEKHAKLGPTEFSTDGVFLCGMAQYPKPIDEAVAQAKAAAGRAITLLTRQTIHSSGTVAVTEPADCCSCGTCVAVCPYAAVSFIDDNARIFPGRARINPVLCKGCGLCVASCRSGAIRLNGFDNDQIFAQIAGINA
jgi:heterodisulfide reductase subunit A